MVVVLEHQHSNTNTRTPTLGTPTGTILAQSLNKNTSPKSTKNWIFRDPEDRIGEGAFAEVFRVHKETSSNKVIEYFALKRLKVVAYENVNEIEALRNEVAIHSSLRHPSIVSLIETYV